MDFLTFVRVQWDRVAAALLAALGGLAVILGYVGASGTAFTAEQIPYIISGAVTGVFLLGVAATLYLSADLRDEWRKLNDIDRHLADLASAASTERPEPLEAKALSDGFKKPTPRPRTRSTSKQVLGTR